MVVKFIILLLRKGEDETNLSAKEETQKPQSWV